MIAETAEQRQRENFYVAPERPVLDIIEIILNAMIQRRVAAPAVDLRQASHAGLDLMAQHIFRDRFAKLFDQRRPLRPRPDEAHFTAQHVDQLRQFIQTRIT